MPYLPFSSALVFLFRTIISACAATISDYVSAGGSSCEHGCIIDCTNYKYGRIRIEAADKIINYYEIKI